MQYSRTLYVDTEKPEFPRSGRGFFGSITLMIVQLCLRLANDGTTEKAATVDKEESRTICAKKEADMLEKGVLDREL